MTKNALNSNLHQSFGEIAPEYHQKFWVFVFAVFEQSAGRDTIPVSVETEVDDLVVQRSLREWRHMKL